MMKSGIYAIVNTVNGKRYIGSSIDIPQRWMQHRKLLRRGKHHSAHLQSAWNKYGEHAFQFVVVEYVTACDLLDVEQKHLDDRPEYNISNDAIAPMRGRKMSMETRRRMSKTRSGKRRGSYAPGTGANISKAIKGRAPTLGFSGHHHSEKSKARIGAATVANHTGKKRSGLAKARMSAAARSKPRSEKQLAHIANLAEQKRGTKCSQETRMKMSDWQIGKRLSKATREKISTTLKTRNSRKAVGGSR